MSIPPITPEPSPNLQSSPDENWDIPGPPPAQVVAVEAGFYPLPILLDFALRWFFLVLVNANWLAEWVFWVAQLLLIPGGVLAWTYARKERILARFNLDKSRAFPRVSSSFGIYLFLSANLGLDVYILNTQLTEIWPWLRVVVLGLAPFLFGVYLLLLYLASYAAPPAQKLPKSKESLPQPAAGDMESSPAIDPLDSRVLNAEARLASLNLSVETYSLESTLFGGLAFSAFLTLISSNVPVLLYTQTALQKLAVVFERFLLWDFETLGGLLATFIFPDHFYALLCLECLFTSLFFILVIASKVRYYALQKHAQLLVQQALKYHQKKDDLDLHTKIKDPVARFRMAALAAQVIKNVETVEEIFKELTAVLNFMNLFRGLGIALFFALLVTGAFLLSSFLGIGVLVFILLTFAYTAFDKGVRERRLNELVRRMNLRGK